MKNFHLKPTIFLFASLLITLIFSCEKEESNESIQGQDKLTSISAKNKNTKVDVCHNGKIINVSVNAVPAHQGHGDAVDLDADGFFDIANSCSATDCDDSDADVNPDAVETVYNGIDDDCDPSTPDDDLDGDGFGIADDCDDNDSAVNPDADEIPYNGIDDDCNENTPDDDLDGDGFINAEDCDDTNADINPDSDEICENEIDDNCNGEIDENCVTLPDPVAFYPFNGNANDESGNNNNGNVVGAILTTDRNGAPNSAYSFDGVNDYIQIGSANENVFTTGDFTVSVWFRSTSTDEGIIWNKRNTSSCSQASGPSNGFSQTSAGNGNTFVAQVRSSRSNRYRIESANPVSDNIWHNAILVKSGNSLTLYFDGAVEGTDNIVPGTNFATTLDLYIGRTIYCSGNYFEGIIDDFIIYDQALTQEQAEFLYSQ